MDTAVKSYAADVADSAAASASQALRSTQGATNAAFDRLSDKLESTRERAVPMIDRLANQAEAARQRSLDAMRDTAVQLRDTASRVSDTTVDYVRDEPMKSILIAAATGAALMGLIGLMTRTRD